jgi:hypothetical protein
MPGNRRLKLVAASDRTASRRAPAPALWLCRVCEAETGVATSAAVRVRLAPAFDAKGRLTGGTDAWACAYCLARGKLTRLT